MQPRDARGRFIKSAPQLSRLAWWRSTIFYFGMTAICILGLALVFFLLLNQLRGL